MMAFIASIVEWFKNLFNKKTDVSVQTIGNVIPIKPKPSDSRDCPWMDLMHSKLGEKEISGNEDNEFIMSLYKYARYHASHDETPWCACAVGWALAESGYKWTKSAAAVSYKNYGDPSKLIRGAIIVLQHPNGRHHVAFFEKFITENLIELCGGNQNNQLRLSTYDLRKEKVIACRWPIKL